MLFKKMTQKNKYSACAYSMCWYYNGVKKINACSSSSTFEDGAVITKSLTRQWQRRVQMLTMTNTHVNDTIF